MSEISRACGGGDAGRSLVPGVLRGYRTWRPARRGARLPEAALPLTSLSRRRIVWPATLTARCTPPDVGSKAFWGTILPGDHDAPHDGCECGIYAWYDPRDTRILHARVFGVIEASGLVLMGERGFRAQKARVAAVVTRNRRVAAACTAAGVDVFRSRRQLVRAYPPDDVSGLLADPEDEAPEDADADEPEGAPGEAVDAGGADAARGRARRKRRPPPGTDRTLMLAVWARTAVIAVAVAALPTAAGLLSALVAEVALIALIATRFR